MSEDTLLRGRPYGGCAILYNAGIGFNVFEIECKHDRLCAGHLKINVIFCL